MSKELVISSNRHETKVAVLEDDQVVEVYFQRENEYSLAGSIHKGRVTRVLPGMQSAFVDVGLDRDAFLYVSDFFEDNEEYDKIVSSVEDQVLKLQKGGVAAPAPAVETPAPRVEAAEPAAAAATAEVRAPERESRGESRPEAHGETRGETRREGRGESRGDSKDEGQDRRGRRSRRRRPGKSPRIPESKYYSPSRDDAPVAAAPREPAPAGPAGAAEDDDFFVLPGESLAKYSQHEDEEAARAEREGGFAAAAEEPEEGAAAAAREPETGAGTEPGGGHERRFRGGRRSWPARARRHGPAGRPCRSRGMPRPLRPSR